MLSATRSLVVNDQPATASLN